MKNKKDFWNDELDYKFSNLSLDIIDNNEYLLEELENEECLKNIVNNIIKSKFYIFNKNKTNIFIDSKVILFSISFLFGFKKNNALIYFEWLEKNDFDKYKELLRGIKKIFEKENLLSDKYSEFQPIPIYLGKNNVRYYSNSFIFTIYLFHNFFNPDKVDEIISFPYFNHFKFLGTYNNIIKDSNFQINLIKNFKLIEMDYFI